MAERISFETGLKTFDLNGAAEVTFNPSSVAFIRKIEDAAQRLGEIQDGLRGDVPDGDRAAFYARYEQADKDMREIVDGLFGAPVCDKIFPRESAYLLDIGGGFPMWANLLYAVADMMDTNLAAEKTAAQTRIRKYSEKYKKK